MGGDALEENYKAFKDWYCKQPHLPQGIEDYYYWIFVSGSKSLERAKQKADTYFSLRRQVFTLMAGVGPGSSKFQDHLQSVYIGIHPDKTAEGARVVLISPKEGESERYHIGCQMLMVNLLIEAGRKTWPADGSYILVEDFATDSGRLRTLDLKHFITFAKYVLGSCPVKLKGFYYINTPTFLERTIGVCINLLPEKFRQKIKVSRDESVLRKALPENMIPVEYGGKGKSMKDLNDYWKRELALQESEFETRSKLMCDESKRPKDSKARETYDFGVEGSFKTLTID